MPQLLSHLNLLSTEPVTLIKAGHTARGVHTIPPLFSGIYPTTRHQKIWRLARWTAVLHKKVAQLEDFRRWAFWVKLLEMGQYWAGMGG